MPGDRQPYVGRFAPSPTGPLHLGSLSTAIASYLDARAHRGTWLLRIDDIDPPREQPGASEHIQQQLLDHGLRWDDEVVFQRRHTDRYAAAIATLHGANCLYRCRCSRRDLAGHRIYPGTCRDASVEGSDTALRIRVNDARVRFHDRFRGPHEVAMATDVGDFIVRRRDGLFAYHLATAIDDAHLVTDVLRGDDLLNSTPQQIHLMRCLGLPVPRYAHVPVLTDDRGVKLSKQAGARAIRSDNAQQNVARVLRGFQMTPPVTLSTCAALLKWATERWLPASRALKG